MAQQTYGEWMRSNPPIPTLTAVEWFWKWQMDNPLANFKDAVDAYKQAKQMEKEQIIEAFDCDGSPQPGEVWISNGEQYYNETYGK